MIKGRGAQINPSNRFDRLVYNDEQVEDTDAALRTDYLPVYPKSMINKISSPDIPFGFSANPYQGCEHGCTYCYARESHNYWGYSAGVDFERKILVKQDAARILEKRITNPKWKAAPIMLSGNTDCYQPAEKEYGLTRHILEVLWKYRHPVSIITKNKLILRDLDLLEKLAAHHLVRVAISITTLNETLRRQMEPRTATAAQRLACIQQLTAAGIPVTAMIAPVIPGLTDAEILPLVKAVAEAGARQVGYTMVRLNGDVATVFEDWIRKFLPDRADRVLNRIRDCRQGQLGDRRFGHRMSGEGVYADIIADQFRLAKERYLEKQEMPPLNVSLFEQHRPQQLKLF